MDSLTPETSTVTLPLDRSAPREARRLLRDLLGVHPRVDDAELALSEIVTHALLHTAAPEVELRMAPGDSVRVAVRYLGDPFAALLRHGADTHLASSLAIVKAVVDRWGMESGDRVEVWFEVA